MFESNFGLPLISGVGYKVPTYHQFRMEGAGYKVPTYHQFRVPLLRDSKKKLEFFIATLRKTWVDTGCTVMSDVWSDGRHITLINFLVYCPRGITFVKSIDTSDAVIDAQLLFKMFQEIIE